eukprot:3939568-Rhodomonas_salina.2
MHGLSCLDRVCQVLRRGDREVHAAWAVGLRSPKRATAMHAGCARKGRKEISSVQSEVVGRKRGREEEREGATEDERSLEGERRRGKRVWTWREGGSRGVSRVHGSRV